MFQIPPLTPMWSSSSSSSDDDNYNDDNNDYDNNDDDNEKFSPPTPTPTPTPTPKSPPTSPDSSNPDKWITRDPTLLPLTSSHPFNGEPPLSLLLSHSFLTPVPLHFVRNHGPVPRLPPSLRLFDLPLDPTILLSFPSFEIPVTLVCAGNRRSELNSLRPSLGFNWGPAAISTSLWRGVRLRHLLKRFHVIRRPSLHVCFQGADNLTHGNYATSITLDHAMDPTADVMIAYMQNGEFLTPDHGSPLRIIIPGFIAGRMVKWVKRIFITENESDSYYHYRDNRVLPSHVDADLAESQGWWNKPEYVINELNVNSVISSPAHDEILQIDSLGGEECFVLRGYAYSGGGRKVTRVEITLDDGETWRICDLNHPEKPNKYGKYWCWCFWSLNLNPLHLLPADFIAVRAWDQSHNTQPQKLTWNLLGMMNNSWFRVKVSSSHNPNGTITLSFQHPTQPGNTTAGWMNRNKIPKHVKNPIFSPKNAIFSLSDLRTHNSPNSPWIAVHGNLYDCTSFLNEHPGGPHSILAHAGSDCTEQFDAIHSDNAKSLLHNYLVGKLSGSKISLTLIAKTNISRTVRVLRFAPPSPVQFPCFPTGKHVHLSAIINQKLCIRAYTPTSSPDSLDHLEILVRIYFKGENPCFPAGGKMSQYLDSLPLGAKVDMEGPAGRIEYVGKGRFLLDGEERIARRVAMVAGGTGIAPIYGVIRGIMREEGGVEKMELVYASRSEGEILLKGELDRWEAERPERLKVWYVVGKLKEGVLKERIMVGGVEGSLALVCGPPGLVQDLILPELEKMGYHRENGSCLVF